MPTLISTPSTAPNPDVLVVDDEDVFCRVFCRALLRQGLTASSCNSSLHAIRTLERHPHLVVVADLVMPGPDGLELLRVVERRWPRSRRILLTAWGEGALIVATPQAHRVVDKSLPLSQVVEIVLEELALAQP